MQPHQNKAWEPQVSIVVMAFFWDWLAGSKQP